MKILWLGTSQNVDGYVPDQDRPPGLVARRLSELLRIRVEIVPLYIWPNERLPELLESWVGEHQPDMVFLDAAAYWYAYESVPLKVQRKFGHVGSPVAKASLKVADTSWLSSNRMYYAAQRLALRTIGGATHFEPEQIVERMKIYIEIILRNPEVTLLIKGFHSMDRHFTLGRRRLWAEARREFVNSSIATFCADLPVTYHGFETEADLYDLRLRFGDRTHLTGEGLRLVARDLVPRFVDAWTARHPGIEARTDSERR